MISLDARPRSPRRPARELVAGATDSRARTRGRSTRARSSRATSSSAWSGERVDGGRFAAGALAAGAWGVLVAPGARCGLCGGAVLAAADPLAALQRLATAWRRELDAAVIGVTGSVGKTSTKQLIAALIAPHRRVAANPANFNTEIGLPLAVLAAPPGHRGAGARDGHARVRADRRAGADRRARRRRDHQHRAGPPRAGRLARGRRAGQGASCWRTCRSRSIPADEPLLEPVPARRTSTSCASATDVMLEDFDPPRVTSSPASCASSSTVPFTSRHQLVNLLAAVAAAQAVGVEPCGPRRRVASGRCAASAWRCRRASSSSTTATTPTRCPCAPRSTISPRRRPTGRRVAVLGDMLELGAGEAEAHREIGAYAAASGVDVLVAVGPLSAVMPEAFGGEAHVVADAARGRVAGRASSCARATSCWSRRHAGSAWRPSRRRWPVGEVLIAGTASLLICIFLSPKFIAFLREREFGQNIREEGPEGHHAKAGTPTMGGIIIFTAIAVPFLLLTDLRLAGDRRLRRRDRVRAAGLRRRLHEARQAALAGPARADEAGRHGADLGRAVARRHRAARTCRTR